MFYDVRNEKTERETRVLATDERDAVLHTFFRENPTFRVASSAYRPVRIAGNRWCVATRGPHAFTVATYEVRTEAPVVLRD